MVFPFARQSFGTSATDPGWGPFYKLDWRPGRFELAFRSPSPCALWLAKSSTIFISDPVPSFLSTSPKNRPMGLRSGMMSRRKPIAPMRTAAR